MRLFVGVPIPEALKAKIVQLQKELAASGTDMKLVEPENLHFTLKFLGEVDERTCETVISRLSEDVQHHHSFSVRLRGVGVFPNPAFVRVVWVGTEENTEFFSLAQHVQETLNDVRKEDHQDIVPHLTVARPRSPRDVKRLLAALVHFTDFSFGDFVVDKVILYQSVLGRGGPAYSVVREFPLA